MKNKSELISAERAFELVMNEIDLAQTHSLPLSSCRGLFLRENIVAERCAPPFDRIMMDGIAVKKADLDAGQKAFPLKGMAQAGHPQVILSEQSACEVCTGAMVPQNADQIIPYEMINLNDQNAVINEYPSESFIHKMGSDFSKGEILLNEGAKLNSPRLGLCASQGKKEILVSKMPQLAIVSTGDELVPPGKELETHQIRLSNPYAFIGELEAWGFKDSTCLHLPDEKETIIKKIGELLADYSFIIFSGAISKGAFDYLPQAFEHHGIKTIFHGVKQKPGKPLFFGKGPKGQLVFALPGNPVSSLINLRRYVVPALLKHAGALQRDFFHAHPKDQVSGKSDFTHFVPAMIEEIEGKLWARTLKTNNSGDYNSLTHSHGFLIINSQKTDKPQVFLPWGGWNYYGPEF